MEVASHKVSYNLEVYYHLAHHHENDEDKLLGNLGLGYLLKKVLDLDALMAVVSSCFHLDRCTEL